MISDKANPFRWYYAAITALGLVLLFVDARMSWNFGATFDDNAKWGLTALSVGSGILLVLVISQWRMGNKLFAKGMFAAWALCFCFNIISNMGVAVSNRLAETQTSNVKQAVHQQRTQSTAEAKARLAVFEKQLQTLVAKNGWAATVTAQGLRDQVAALQVSRASEAKLGGCGTKCRGIENQIVAIQGKIAIAEQRQNLDKRIAATKAVLAEARNTLANTDAGVSLVSNQAALYPRWTVGWVGDGESAAAIRNSNEMLGILMALVIAVASAALTLAGRWPDLMNCKPEITDGFNVASSLPTVTTNANRSTPQDNAFLKAVRDATASIAPEQPRIAA